MNPFHESLLPIPVSLHSVLLSLPMPLPYELTPSLHLSLATLSPYLSKTKVKPNSHHKQEKANDMKATQSDPSPTAKLQQLEVQVPNSSYNDNNNSINDDTTCNSNNTTDNNDTECSAHDNNLGIYSSNSNFSNDNLAYDPGSDRPINNLKHKGTSTHDDSKSTSSKNGSNSCLVAVSGVAMTTSLASAHITEL
jgi:hypothetical protein